MVVLLAGLFALRSPLHCDDCSGCTNLAPDSGPFLESEPHGDRAVRVDIVCFPAADAGPWDYWTTARESCEAWGVDRLARQFDSKPTAGAVASAYSHWIRTEAPRTSDSHTEEVRAVRAGCLQGFRARL